MTKLWATATAVIWIFIFSIYTPTEEVKNHNNNKGSGVLDSARPATRNITTTTKKVVAEKNVKELLLALYGVEASYRPSPPDGDDGKSIGPYQIQWAYWKDSKVPGVYGDVRNKEYAEKVIMAYWKCYAPGALKNKDFERLARCHNSGPDWRVKYGKTNSYWNDVKVELDKKIGRVASG